VRFQVLTAPSMNMTALWDIAACSLVEVDRRFSGAYCLRQGDEWAPTRLHSTVTGKAVVFKILLSLSKEMQN
jgi:hypothetical protein